MSDYMKKPCAQCPFRRDVRPYLHPDRAYEIAAASENPYNEFSCHKTTESTDDGRIVTAESKECAGFLTLRANYTERGLPEGFEPAFKECYEDSWGMEWHYREVWEKRA